MRRSGPTVIGNGPPPFQLLCPPLEHSAIYHHHARPSLWLLAGSSSTGNSWTDSPPPQRPPLKSPLKSVVMQTVGLQKEMSRCRVCIGWASNAVIISGWLDYHKSICPPLMWTWLINTRLQGGMEEWMDKAREEEQQLHFLARCFVALCTAQMGETSKQRRFIFANKQSYQLAGLTATLLLISSFAIKASLVTIFGCDQPLNGHY